MKNKSVKLPFVTKLKQKDVTNIGNGERESGNECTAVTRLII